jgi:membrane protease YdiL (CAAX protease family)
MFGLTRFRWLPATVVLALAMASPMAEQAGADTLAWLMAAGLGGLTLLYWLLGHESVARFSLGLTALAVAGVLPWLGSWWPIPAVVGLCVFFVAHASAARGRSRPPKILRRGRFGALELSWVLGLVLVSAAALLVFRALTSPPVSDLTYLLTAMTPGSLMLVGAAFAMVNAFVEELLFRGVILHHLQRAMPTAMAVGLQALAFGMLHLNAYPYGPAGVALAATYGLLLGIVRVRTGGLLACWAAHVCADIVIFALLVQGAP